MRGRLSALVALIHLFGLATCVAQPTDGAPSPEASRPDTSTTPQSSPSSSSTAAVQALSAHTFSAWGEGSVATGTLLGNIQQAQLGILGVRYERLLVPPPHDATSPSGPTLTYTAAVVPVLRLSMSSKTVSPLPEGRSPAARTSHLDTYGVGVNPAGLRVTFRAARRVQPVLSGSAGLVYLGQPIPSKRGTQFNFVFDVGAGLRVVLTPDLLLSAGYRYHHLSNGFRGQVNPGVDANLLYLGVSFAR
ncbi:MAG: acyloxyacyl hydrolase [Salinibacter sp.]